LDLLDLPGSEKFSQGDGILADFRLKVSIRQFHDVTGTGEPNQQTEPQNVLKHFCHLWMGEGNKSLESLSLKCPDIPVRSENEKMAGSDGKPKVFDRWVQGNFANESRMYES
jgi:hypothetical protein